MSLFFKVPMLADICVWIHAHVFMKIKSILTIYYLILHNYAASIIGLGQTNIVENKSTVS